MKAPFDKLYLKAFAMRKRKEPTYSIKYSVRYPDLCHCIKAERPDRPQAASDGGGGHNGGGTQSDYLDLLHNHFTDGGFGRLMRDGATLSNVDYGPGVMPPPPQQ